MRIAVGARTDVGRGRPANEDSYLAPTEGRLFAVADGMGGHRAGEVASAVAIDALQDAFEKGAPLDEAMSAANAAVFARAAANLDMRGMGTTLTAAALVEDNRLLLGHVGDSRAYLMRGGDVIQVTEDHSLVEQLVREGRLRPEEAAVHPQKAIITRALGIDPEVEVDIYPIHLRPGDRVVLCSDGLTNMVSDSAMAGVLRRERDPQQAAEALVDMANDAGGDDNITVVVIDAVDDGKSAAPHHDEPTGEWMLDVDEVDGVDEVDEVEDQPAEVMREERPQKPPRARKMLLWLIPVVLILGAGLAAVGWYARRTYYVGLSGDRVTLYRGVPGGVLGWDPTVERRSSLIADDLTPAQRADLEDGHRFSSRTDAARFLDRLEEQQTPPPPPPPEPVPGPPITTTPFGTR